MRVRRVRLVVAMAALLIAAACAGPLELANIQVGRSLNQDRSISSITTLFKPNETVYVSVQTKAAGKGTISVIWKYGTRVIDQPSKQVSYNGPASTEFHLQNSGGFPPGDYSVDVLIDGVQVGSRAFKVDRYFE
jgi:archaellum component FlaG (FlaF/FlaG flagellin family)